MERALLHTSTFGGNTMAAAAAIAALEVTFEENLPGQAWETGQQLLTGLYKLKDKYSLVKEVRGCGLMVGVEFNQPGGLASKASFGLVNKFSEEYTGSMVAGELLNKHRIITAYTLNNPNVIRLEPPLNVTPEQIDTLLQALEQVFAEHKSFFSMAASGAKTVLKSFIKK